VSSFYCYLHMRPDKEGVHSIFYVGKGNEKRIRLVHRRNRHHTRIVSKVGLERVEVQAMECSTEAAAFELEVGIIKCLRRMGVKLCNRTDGGEGISGHVHTRETKTKMSLSHTGIPLSAATKANMSIAHQGNTYSVGRIVSVETRAKLSMSSSNPSDASRVAMEHGQRNAGVRSTNTSGYRGVQWCKSRNRWVAKVQLRDKVIHLGSFHTIEEAAAARKAGEEKYWK